LSIGYWTQCPANNIGTKSPPAMTYTNSYYKNLGLRTGRILQDICGPKKQKFCLEHTWGTTTNVYLNLLPKTLIIELASDHETWATNDHYWMAAVILF
jgi:hypothetical protein